MVGTMYGPRNGTNYLLPNNVMDASMPFIDVTKRYGTDATAINTAYAAAVAAGGGTLFLAKGTYTYSSDLNWTSNLVSVMGAGSAEVVLQSVSTAKILARPSTFTVVQGPKFSGFTVRGTSTTNAIGILSGDIIGAEWDDIVIENFTGTGAIGLKLDNASAWTERNHFKRLWLNNNTIGVKCLRSAADTGMYSFGYNRWTDIRFNVNSGQIGFQTADNVKLYNNDFTVIANVTGTAPVIFDVTSTSQMNGRMFLTAEPNSGSGSIGVRVANGALFSMVGHRTYNGSAMVDSNLSTLTNGGTFAATLRHLAGTAKGLGAPLTKDAGVRVDFIGTDDADMLPVIADDIAPMYASVGFLTGANIVSTFFTCYNVAGNGFVFYAVPASSSLGSATEVARITSAGEVIAQEKVIEVSGTTRTLGLIDRGATLYCYGASCAITVPANATVNFPVGTRIRFIGNMAAGALTLAGAGAAGVYQPTGQSLSQKAPMSEISIVQVAVNVWVAGGDLTGA